MRYFASAVFFLIPPMKNRLQMRYFGFEDGGIFQF